MKLKTIIWDFDGTILPSSPYDSEQTLLLYKLNKSRENISFFKKLVARAIIYADRKEWLGGSFKTYYLWVLKGTPIDALDRVAESLVNKITKTDRQCFFRLKEEGYHMMILSCGTADLIERVINLAGLDDCFTLIPGNRFQFTNNLISGMDFLLIHPRDKLQVMQALGISIQQSIVVGDGYTDLPILDAAGIPVMVDRIGKKREKYIKKNYHFISSIAELCNIL
jgi:phosphoserine phosphatase